MLRARASGPLPHLRLYPIAARLLSMALVTSPGSVPAAVNFAAMSLAAPLRLGIVRADLRWLRRSSVI